MPFADVNQTRVFYAERGNRGLPVVFVHGAAANHLIWGEQVRAVGAMSRAVAIDLPGHGRSAPPGCNTMDAYRDVVLGLLDALAFDRAVIVGHSMGGGIAQTLAVSHPDRVAGLGLVGTGARLRVLPALLDGVLSPGDFSRTAQFVVDLSYAAGVDARLRERALAEFRACPPIVIHGDFAACDAFDLMSRLGEIRAPALVVCGRQDQMTPLKYAEFLASHIPKARLVIVENAGHSSMLEQPGPLNQALADFIRAL